MQHLMPHTDTNDSICNSSTSASRNNNKDKNNNNNGTEKVINIEINTVTTSKGNIQKHVEEYEIVCGKIKQQCRA